MHNLEEVKREYKNTRRVKLWQKMTAQKSNENVFFWQMEFNVFLVILGIFGSNSSILLGVDWSERIYY